MQSFADENFPLPLSRKAVVRQEFSTRIVALKTGHERRSSQWSDARLSFDVGPALGSEAAAQMLIRFFRARRGASQSFRFRDPTDYSSNGMTQPPTALDQMLGAGDGEKADFALVKQYGDDPEDAQQRRISRPVANSLLVSIDGANVQNWVLLDGGRIEFTAPPPAGTIIRAGYLFDVEVRFQDDILELAGETFGAVEMPSVPLIEVKGEVT